MIQRLLPSPQQQRTAALLAQMPPWFDRGHCVVSESKENVYLTFKCNCSALPSALKQQSVYIGKKTDLKQIAEVLSKAVIKRHGHHQGSLRTLLKSDAEMLAESSLRVEQLQKDVERQKRKAMDFERNAGLIQTKFVKTEKELNARKMVDARAGNRRVEIDPQNHAEFSQQNKSTAMRADGTGIYDTLKYWCEGSHTSRSGPPMA